ncbi:MAG: RNA polymerase subunit sigma-70, partial [Candidatus Dormibacteria bacterium]
WRGGRHLRLVPTRANTQPAFGCYLADPDRPAAMPTGILVLTLSGDRISTITRFLDDALPRRFGLPDVLP